MASDSATTLTGAVPSGGTGVLNIYDNANKIFNLRKGLPLAAMTWGQGNVGPASIATLAKDFRRRISGESLKYSDWEINPATYTMDEVAKKFREFFFDEKYQEQCAANPGSMDRSTLGLLLAGYGPGEDQPELFSFDLSSTGCDGPKPALPSVGATWWGQPEAIARVMLGTSLAMPQALINLGVEPDKASAYFEEIKNQVGVPLVTDAMPIQDAIDLAYFLVELTIQYVRFAPGHKTVGGPIEVAAISKHEGFRWVRRKHYFDATLNSTERGFGI